MTIKIKVLHSYPFEIEDQLDAYSKKEMEVPKEWKEQMISASAGAWLISMNDEPMAIIGVIQHSLISRSAEVWFLIYKGAARFRKTLIRFCKKGARRLLRCYEILDVRIELGYAKNARFVEFFGFKPVYEASAITGQHFMVHQLRASWLQQ